MMMRMTGSVLWTPEGHCLPAYLMPAVTPGTFSWLYHEINVSLCLWAGYHLLWNDTSVWEHFLFSVRINFFPLWAWANHYGEITSSWQLLLLSHSGRCHLWVWSSCASCSSWSHLSLWALLPADLSVHNFSFLLLPTTAEVCCVLGVTFLSDILLLSDSELFSYIRADVVAD